jgi:hypothetical protein
MRGDPLGVPLGPVGIAGSTPYTPTITWTGNTITTPAGYSLKLPGLLLVWVTFTVSAGGSSGTISISAPAGFAAIASVNVGVVQPTTAALSQPPNMLQVAAGSLSAITCPLNVIANATTYSAFAMIPTTT